MPDTYSTQTYSRQEKFVSVAEEIWCLAERQGSATALAFACGQITFQDLVTRASVLANKFRNALARDRDIIAIATNDPAHLIIAALAAWRSGCAYLPVDPIGPALRLQHMLAEAGVKLIATSEESSSSLPSGPCNQVIIDGPNSKEDFHSQPAEWGIRPDDIAYVIYTSGSTGLSKGVAVTHANLKHLVKWHTAAFAVSPQDRGTQFASLTFDATVLESWPLLAAGASLYLPDRSITLAPERLRDYLVAQQITLAFAATPLAEHLIRLDWPASTRLRYLLTGADTLHSFAPPSLPFRLVNNYGPTECTVLATSGIVPAHGETLTPSIGSATPGTRVFLLDDDLRPVAEGERGQICVAGDGVAAGYIGRPDLTGERFVAIPSLTSSRVYLTGDLGRQLPNGEFEFCGRLDDQIKLRGYRIEPGEITAALRSHPAITAAAVTTIGEGAAKQLAAYVVPNGAITADDLRTYLESRIPPYMVPNHFIRLSELPVTSNGKINRAALPLPNPSNSLEQPGSLSELETEVQVEVASILSSLLEGQPIGLHDNFFRIGGHSLLAAQIMSRIRSTFQVDLPLRTVFESPSVAALSQQIETRILSELTSVAAAGGAA
ncbi:MAG: non-ribosomal peptide synthetase [Acidobacteriaceae bacterium]|nr:non-ribosomal peptide synthetase [Acidobacteriaceae bacterium]